MEVRKLINECKARGGKFNNFIYEKEILFCSRKGRRPYDPQIVKRVVMPVSLRAEALALCHDGFGEHISVRRRRGLKYQKSFIGPPRI